MNKGRKYDAIIFDLDGTLLDTSDGIVKCVEHASSILNLPKLPMERKLSFVGPPLLESFKREFALNEPKAKKAVEVYRKRYSEEGLFEASVYDGMKELLFYLKEKGYLLAVATLKREDFAKRILEHFQLSAFFDVIVGIDNDDSLTKADTIRLALDKISVSNVNQVLMVGDSEYDKVGADLIGVDFCAVMYGFGFKKECGIYYNYEINEPLDLMNEDILSNTN